MSLSATCGQHGVTRSFRNALFRETRKKSFSTARPARPFAARLMHHSPPSSALRSSSHPPQLAQPSPSQLASHSLQLAQPGPSQLVSSTTARPAWPFEARLIRYSSPSPVLRRSYHSPQLAQLGPSQLVSFTTAVVVVVVVVVVGGGGGGPPGRCATGGSPGYVAP